jgi:hypothetical protein
VHNVLPVAILAVLGKHVSRYRRQDKDKDKDNAIGSSKDSETCSSIQTARKGKAKIVPVLN